MDDPIAWARQEAQRLRSANDVSHGQFALGLEFLRKQAGSQSAFYQQANKVSDGGWAFDYRARVVADALEAWADGAADGLADQEPFETRARVTASTDLMEQVQLLLDDRRVHAAAPAVLAGAALEEFLRALASREGLSLPTRKKPGLAAYAEVLKSAEVFGAQDVKDVTAWAGIRNSAAHGDFDAVTLDRVRLMVDGINLFMRQHSTHHDAV